MSLLVVAVASAARADRHYSSTCAITAPIHVAPVNRDDSIVGVHDTLAYESCKGRIPERFKDTWPLADCSADGRGRFSSGDLAGFPQTCSRA